MIMEPNNENNNSHNKPPKPSIDEALQHYGEHAAFAPRFAARVQERILAQQHSAQVLMMTPFEAVLQEIWQLFPRFAFAGVAAAAILAFYNVSLSPESGVEWSLGDAFGISAEVQENVLD
jgi:hypothetical protein